jgi:hypothetical protein
MFRKTSKQITGTNISFDPFVFRVPDENETPNQHPWKLSRGECVLNALKKKDCV